LADVVLVDRVVTEADAGVGWVVGERRERESEQEAN
jgi:hypothetical protein